MSTSPAEVLEELKELRRHGDLNSGILLKAVQGLPLLSPELASQVGGPGPEVLVRLLDIRTLAERVFGAPGRKGRVPEAAQVIRGGGAKRSRRRPRPRVMKHD